MGRNVCLALLAVLMWSSPASRLAAQSTAIDETYPLSPDASVQLEVVSHSLVVEAWDQSEIQIVGTYDAEFERFEVQPGPQAFRAQIEYVASRDERRRDGETRELRVRVPAGVTLEVEAVSGSLHVSGLSARVEAESVSGSVEIESDLQVLRAASVSGSVAYRGDASEVGVESVSGSVTFVGRAQELEAESVSGSLDIRGGAEIMELSSVSGRISIDSDAPIRSLEAESTSGSIDVAGGLASGGSIDLDSFSGRIEVLLDSGVDASFDLETSSGAIRTNLADVNTDASGRRGPGRSVEFVTGSGAGSVDIETLSGGIRVDSR